MSQPLTIAAIIKLRRCTTCGAKRGEPCHGLGGFEMKLIHQRRRPRQKRTVIYR